MNGKRAEWAGHCYEEYWSPRPFCGMLRRHHSGSKELRRICHRMERKPWNWARRSGRRRVWLPGDE